jgi:NtrC-family two-component system response regulator AlgB
MPAKARGGKPKGHASKMTPRRAKAKVLVVDDEPAVLSTYKMILEQSGYDAVAASTSREAIKAIAEIDFDLILSDFSLEQQHTGFEVIGAAKKKNKNVSCCILTGYATLETADQAEAQGIGILYKPIDIEEFLQTTKKLLGEEP